jgi:hypothetical protein
MSMTEKLNLLARKIKITADPERIETPFHKHASFYLHYSSFVLKSLQKSSFQKFLGKMLRKENIQEHNITEVNIKVFPFRRENGKGLAGNCNTSQGKIQIFPKTMTFCRAFKQKFGKNTFIAYACSRARAALIHELLHLKYATNEKRVRELAKKYFFAFTRRKPFQERPPLFSYTMIFAATQTRPTSFLKINTTPTNQLKL